MLLLSLRRCFVLLTVCSPGFASGVAANTVVSGHIDHPKGREVAVWIGQQLLSDKPLTQVKASLDAKGDFRLELPNLRSPTQATLAYGATRTSLFLTPGDKLQVTYDTQKYPQSLTFAGTKPAAAAAAYLRECEEQFPEYKKLIPEGARLTPNQFQQLADGDRLKNQAFLKTYAATHALTPVFLAHARQAMAFQMAARLLRFHPAYVPWHWYDEAPKEKAPAAYYEWLEKVRPSQDSALATNCPQYQAFLVNFAQLRMVQPAADPAASEVMAQATAQFGTGASRELVLANYLADFLVDKPSIARAWGGEHSAAKVTPLMAAFKALNPDAALLRTVNGLYESRRPLEAGEVAPAFRLWDDQGRPVSLASFKGKVVYLDFWASWCGPCISEVPAAQKLKKQFEGKDVVFLYVSSDSNAAWKKALAKNSLRSPNSVHLRDSVMHRVLGKQWPVASTAYHIDFVPTYFIIGRDGRLLDVNAPRPSHGERAVQALNQALSNAGQRPKRS